MSDEIEYIEPTQEHVGQLVEVRDHIGQRWKRMQLCGSLNMIIVTGKQIGRAHV